MENNNIYPLYKIYYRTGKSEKINNDNGRRICIPTRGLFNQYILNTSTRGRNILLKYESILQKIKDLALILATAIDNKDYYQKENFLYKMVDIQEALDVWKIVLSNTDENDWVAFYYSLDNQGIKTNIQ